MIKPSVVMVWPGHVDFPLCRYNLKRFKDYFKHIYIAFAYAYIEEDYRNFIKSDLSFATFIDVIRDGPDWRDNAVNSILDVTIHNSSITHYLFLEQDFLIKDNHFWDTALKAEWDFLYYDEADRIHPAFAMIKKDIVHNTGLDFAAHPDDFNEDHFGMFFREVMFQANDYMVAELKQLGLKDKEDFYHCAGQTQNFACYKNNQPFYKPQEFLGYVSNSRQLPDIPVDFDKILANIETEFGKGEANGFLKGFFP